MTENETRILSIDFGLKRIGLALSDPLKIFAYPYKTLYNTKDYFFDLKEIIQDQSVIKVIIGIPTRDNVSTKKIIDEINSLKSKIEQLGIEVITWDESFTSLIAGERVIESVTKKNKRKDKGLIDRHSAAIILQEFLEQKGNR